MYFLFVSLPLFSCHSLADYRLFFLFFLRFCSTHGVDEYSIMNLYAILIMRSDYLVPKIVLKVLSTVGTE